MLLLTVRKSSYTFDFSDVVAGVIDLNESASVLQSVPSRLFHERRSICTAMTATVVRACQDRMSQQERLLVRSWVLPLEVCVGNYGALKQEYVRKIHLCGQDAGHLNFGSVG